jgi:DNA-binding PadR family transcriptional regulator
MRTVDFKITILKMFRRGEFYGYDIHRRLEREGIEIEFSRLYRILNGMDKENLLKSRWEKSTAGPRKKIYTIGEEGIKELRKIFLEAVGTVHDFYGDYLFGLYPKIKIFDEVFDWLMGGLKGSEKVGYLINNNSTMHEMVIHNLRRRIPQGRLYIIVSKKYTRKLNVESVEVIRGEYDNISLKNNFLDMIVTIEPSSKEILEVSLREFSRVLDQDGRLGIIAPSVLVQKQEDPLTIGDFIEKNEHEVIEHGKPLEKEYLFKIMRKYFQTIKEKELVHMTLIQASIPVAHAAQ